MPARRVGLAGESGEARAGVDWAQREMDEIAVQQVLEVVADFDESGGASPGLVAWELFVDEHRVAGAWEQAQAGGLLRPAAHDRVQDERLWRLTADGWARLTETGGDHDGRRVCSAGMGGV